MNDNFYCKDIIGVSLDKVVKDINHFINYVIITVIAFSFLYTKSVKSQTHELCDGNDTNSNSPNFCILEKLT